MWIQMWTIRDGVNWLAIRPWATAGLGALLAVTVHTVRG
jgi:hypothetical protein